MLVARRHHVRFHAKLTEPDFADILRFSQYSQVPALLIAILPGLMPRRMRDVPPCNRTRAYF